MSFANLSHLLQFVTPESAAHGVVGIAENKEARLFVGNGVKAPVVNRVVEVLSVLNRY